MQEQLRMCRTTQLEEAATRSRDAVFNRLLPEELMGALDPDGVHIIEPMMFHQHAGGELVKEHLRCRVYLKVPSASKPVITIADFHIEDLDVMASVDREAV